MAWVPQTIIDLYHKSGRAKEALKLRKSKQQTTNGRKEGMMQRYKNQSSGLLRQKYLNRSIIDQFGYQINAERNRIRSLFRNSELQRVQGECRFENTFTVLQIEILVIKKSPKVHQAPRTTSLIFEVVQMRINWQWYRSESSNRYLTKQSMKAEQYHIRIDKMMKKEEHHSQMVT